jgi:hypothetical protein
MFMHTCFLFDIINILLFSQEGHVAPDNSIGRFISETVSSLPKLSPPAFDKLVNNSLQVNKGFGFF